MPLYFVDDHLSKRPDNIKRVQIHVVQVEGYSHKGSTKCPSAYVTIDSPDLGALHQTSTAGRTRSLVWHENTRILQLRPSTELKFTLKRHSRWPLPHSTLCTTETYHLSNLIAMQGKNDRDTYVNLSLRAPHSSHNPPPYLVINIRDLDTEEKMRKIREHARRASIQLQQQQQLEHQDLHHTSPSSSSSKGKAKTIDTSLSPSYLTADIDTTPTTPTTAASFSSFSLSSPSSSTTSMSSTGSAPVSPTTSPSGGGPSKIPTPAPSPSSSSPATGTSTADMLTAASLISAAVAKTVTIPPSYHNNNHHHHTPPTNTGSESGTVTLCCTHEPKEMEPRPTSAVDSVPTKHTTTTTTKLRENSLDAITHEIMQQTQVSVHQ
ncbi:hypothetical protein AMATHDRAFT_3956 [Amanita thiersii Skay4041]|uniref:C2 domain-containing protein n=1 Tax=Amanita thiersii Skay4041 TaxID=703135 RepID=A0A2A9NS21_9AGAR|nr:hypothetical protein AMATHDRAFT_3956 [Amanita thiersii Skay4041]